MPTELLTAAKVIQIPGPAQPAPAPPAAAQSAPAQSVAAQPVAAELPAGVTADLDSLTGPDGPGSPGTLLAVVPIPGTDSSLAIVGYTVPAATGRDRAQPLQRAGGGGLVVDHARRCVWLGGQEVQLTYQEFELLAFLSSNPAQVFSRADLLERVWGQRENSRHHTRTVDVHVSRLRRKLGPAFGQCLTTEHRVGYRFDPTMDVSG
jgi:Transcriptional regulatory protein, C terminal